MVPWVPCSDGRGGEPQETLATLAQATRHPASGGCGPTSSSAWTRAWNGTSATSHQEAGLPGPCCGHKVTSKEDPFQPTCPLAYQTLGRLPILALSVLYSSPGNHCELPPALSQSVLSPTDLHPPSLLPATTSTHSHHQAPLRNPFSPVSKVTKTPL